MKSNKLIIFAIITIVAILAATMMSRHRAPETSVHKQTLFPKLLDKVNDVTSVSLKKQDKSLNLVRKDGQWAIQEADNYPADFAKIRETVIAVAELETQAEKTSNPELYKRLGVEDPSATTASSLQLSLSGVDGTLLASIIVGKNRLSKSSSDNPGLYVRLPDAKTALLVGGRLDVSTDVKDWFKSELFDINASRIRIIQIDHVDGSVVKLGREKNVDEFNLEDLPKGMQMQSSVIISRMGTMLEDLRADNVVSANRLAKADQTTTTIHTFDGLIITINSAESGGINYSSFGFAVDENVAKKAGNEHAEKDKTGEDDKSDPVKQAETLNKIMSGWAYAMPSFKYELFTNTMDKLSKKPDSAGESTQKKKKQVRTP